MPRNASAGASLRRATRFNAPSGSPAARACAAAVISESIGIPSHLLLPLCSMPASVFVNDGQRPGHIENRARAEFNQGETDHEYPDDEHTPDRIAAGVGHCATEFAGKREGVHPLP